MTGRRGAGDRIGQLGRPSEIAPPLVALVALIVVAVVSIGLVNGELPSLGGKPGGSGGPGPARTPTPSNIVVVDPRTRVPGSIIYVKDGNIWLQSGSNARQLTSSGHDAMPTWSTDGTWIYYVTITDEVGSFPSQGTVRRYLMAVPYLMRVKPGAGSEPEQLATGRYKSGKYDWFYFLRQPVPSPDGTVIALVADGPDPAKSDVVLQFFDPATKKLASAGAAQNPPLGHQDPAWRPDGAILLYVKNGRDGSRGAPVIERYDRKTKKSTALTGPGYLQPAWSPDGRYVAATRTDSFGTDVVLLDAANGAELLRVTSDGASFAPAWSPAGDAIAYLHIDGGIVDLQQVALKGDAPTWTLGASLALTEAAGLEAGSRPSWYIPPDQLPPPSPSPTVPSPTVPSTTVPPASGSPAVSPAP